MDDFTIIGKRIPRIEGREKAIGQAQYADDLALPAMLYGKILRSPFPHARILGIDISRAARLPGVKAVITAEDTPKVKYGILLADQLALATERVRCIGDEVAAVSAVDEDTALEALELVRVDYEELPAVFEPDEALKPEAPVLHPQGPREGVMKAHTTGNIAIKYSFGYGDVEQAFGKADYIQEDEFTTQPVQHCPLEPHACLVDIDASGRLAIWSPIQNIFMVRSQLAAALRMPEHKIRIIQPHVGGAFGCKFNLHALYPISALLAIKSGRPVKIAYSREEVFTIGRLRHPTKIRLKTAVKADGTILARQSRVIVDNGAYSDEGPGVLRGACMSAHALYNYGAEKVEGLLVYTNNPYGSAFRGYGNPQGAFAVESQMDMIAERLGMDPAALRLKNVRKAGDVTGYGRHIRSCGIRECIQAATQPTPSETERKEAIDNAGGQDKSADGSAGMACLAHSSGARVYYDYDGSTALVGINNDGTVTLTTGEGNLGQGTTTIFAQIVAEVLGVPIEDIVVSPADTQTTPYVMGSFADRLTVVGGNAVRLAADHARGQLLEAAAEMLEASVQDLQIRDRRISVKGYPQKAVSIADAAKARLFRKGGAPVEGVGHFDSPTQLPDPQTCFGDASATFLYGTQMAKVRVDTETGQMEVVEIVAAHDGGRILNPMNAEGQIEGSLAQGLGYAFSEELAWERGSTLNPRFRDYGLLTALDIPPAKTVFVAAYDPVGPLGAKGLAEPGLVPTAPAIANALYHALGVRIKKLPITPETVLRALGKL